MDRKECESRRGFLKVLSAGSVLSVLPACSSGPSDPEAFGDVSAGNVSALPVGTLQAIPGAPAYIGRDAGGLYAMTSTCTHEGCDMIRQGSADGVNGVFCACHGSRFDVNGAVRSGPADSPLTHFAVDLDATGNITVHGGKTVSAETRTAVG